MKEFLLTLLQAVIIAAVPVLTAYLCNYLKTKKEEARRKIKDDTGKNLLGSAFDAVVKAVTCTNQTYVDTLKKSGQFTVENQKEAFQRSYDTAVSIMTQEAKDFISEAYGSLSGWLTVQIEAQVKNEKAE